MVRLPGFEIRDGNSIVAFFRASRRDVDDDARSDQTLDRNLVHRGAALEEVDRRVDVGAAMLRRRQPVRGVEITPLGHAPRRALQPKPRFGRPVDRRLLEGVGQVDHLALVDRPLLCAVDDQQRQADRYRPLHRTLLVARYTTMRCPFRNSHSSVRGGSASPSARRAASA